MDDHFWPSMYPGLIVGALYGFSLRGLLTVLPGTAGGLAGAFAAYMLTYGMKDETGFLSLAALIAAALAGAALTVRVFEAIAGHRKVG